MTPAALYIEWSSQYARGVQLFAESADPGPVAELLEAEGHRVMLNTRDLEERIGLTTGIDGAIAKLRVALVGGRMLQGIADAPSALWCLVMGALRDLEGAFPMIAEDMGAGLRIKDTGSVDGLLSP